MRDNRGQILVNDVFKARAIAVERNRAGGSMGCHDETAEENDGDGERDDTKSKR